MSASACRFRPAGPGDADAAVPLIYSSGPGAFDYVFAVPGRGDGQSFLHYAFVDGAGEFGWRNHVGGVIDDRMVAVGACFGGATTWVFTLAAARQILGFYRLRGTAGVIARGLQAERVMPPPTGRMAYLAHLGVAPDLRGQGVGTSLIGYLIERALAADANAPIALDVATTNAAAQRLYERLGFEVVAERRSTYADARGGIADHRRMHWRAPLRTEPERPRR